MPFTVAVLWLYAAASPVGKVQSSVQKSLSTVEVFLSGSARVINENINEAAQGAGTFVCASFPVPNHNKK